MPGPAKPPRRWWHIGDRHAARARLRRRAFPIHAYIGPNGSGKSWAATYDSMVSLDFGRPVLSTVRLLDWRDPGPCPGGAYCDDPDNHYLRRFRWELVEQDDPTMPPVLQGVEFETGEVHRKRHPYFVPWRTYSQLLTWRDGDVFADEITGFASSREIKNMPPQVANYLVQLRRRNVVLRWTTPSWGRADTIIREVTQAVTLCVGMYGKRRPTPPGQAPRLWRDNRLFMVRTYDPHEFDEVEARRLEHASPAIWAMYWRPKGLTEAAYDTLDVVNALGWANEAGVCISCGGERRRSKCSCPKEHDGGAGAARGGSPARKRSGAGVPATADPADRPLLLPVGGSVVPVPQRSEPLDLAEAVRQSHEVWSQEDGDGP